MSNTRPGVLHADPTNPNSFPPHHTGNAPRFNRAEIVTLAKIHSQKSMSIKHVKHKDDGAHHAAPTMNDIDDLHEALADSEALLPNN